MSLDSEVKANADEYKKALSAKDVTKISLYGNRILDYMKQFSSRTKIINPLTGKTRDVGGIRSVIRKKIEEVNIPAAALESVQENKEVLPKDPFENITIEDLKQMPDNDSYEDNVEVMPLSEFAKDIKEEKHGVPSPAVVIQAGKPLMGSAPIVGGPDPMIDKKMELKEQLDEIRQLQKSGIANLVKEYENKGQPLPDFIKEGIRQKILNDKLNSETQFFDYLGEARNIIDYTAGTKYSALFTVPNFIGKKPPRNVQPQLEPTDNTLFQLDRQAQIERFKNALGTNQEQKNYTMPFTRYMQLGKAINTIGFTNAQQRATTSLPLLGFTNVDPPEPTIPGIKPQQYVMAMTR
jgi:hypothetical protein